MANEAVIIELLGDGGEPTRFTVANAENVSAGSLMHLMDPRTVTKTQTDYGKAPNEFFAGVAAADKEAGDGATSLTVYTRGIFDVTSSGDLAISAGNLVVISGANLVAAADDQTTINSGRIVGKALEDVATGATEVFTVAIGVYN